MKQIFFIVFSLVFFAACKNDNPANNMDSDQSLSTEVKEMTPKKSVGDYEAAIQAFTKGEKAKAAAYLDNSIQSLKEESKALEQSAKADVDAVIISLESLSKKVKDGTIKEAGEAKAAFAKAEIAVAHSYMIISQNYIKTAPEKAKAKMEEATKRIENAMNHLEGTAKIDAKELLADTKTGLNNFDKKSEEVATNVGAHVAKFESWLGKHAKEMGIYPGYDPDE